ncbi:MAG: hypothetical protein EPN82_05065 [Bacteroidetes bacterium]|nr:MAG: hypothetical protein EPN82_05065 [Bacteroidota bacterium]
MTNSVSKPLYKKTWSIVTSVIVIIILISLIIRFSNPKYFEELERKQAEKDSLAKIENLTKQNEPDSKTLRKDVNPESIKIDFKNKIGELKTYLKEDLPNSNNPSYQVEILDKYKYDYITFKYSELKDNEKDKLLQEFKSIFIKVCVRQFPKIRTNYVNNVENDLWKNNITIKLRGSNKDILRFIGGIFANNKNKSDMQETISSIMDKLRFKRVEYLWYEYDDSFTYYSISSLKDSYFD